MLNIPENELRQLYSVQLMSTPDIAALFNCSKPVILDRLRKYQIHIRTSKEAHNITPYLSKSWNALPESELRRLYQESGLTMREIALLFDISKSCVRKNFIRHKIPIRTKSEALRMPARMVQLRATTQRPEWVEANRQGQLRRYRDPAERQRTSLAAKNSVIRHSPDWRATARAKTKALYDNDPNRRVRQSERQKQMWKNDDEMRRQAGLRSKERWTNPEYKNRMSQAFQRFWRNGDTQADKRRRRMMAGMNISPNKPETSVLDILNSVYPGDWKFVGDGQVIIGGLNPDIININGKKLIIEIFGDYWHKQIVKPYRVNIERIAVYAKYGYRTLVIWEHEIKDTLTLTERIRAFIHEE